MLAERLLQRRQLVGVGEALDGLDVGAVDLHRQHQAGAHRRAVDDHRAGAADAMLAADVRAGQSERVAQKIAEMRARFDVGLALSRR